MTDEVLTIRLHPEIDRRVNFAMQQNDVPVVKAISIENGSSAPLRDLRLHVKPEPDFASPWESAVELIAENSTYNIAAIDLLLSPKFLGEITERVRGQLRFELFKDEKRLAECVESVELLARDEWNGLSSLPEILAAFIMPNHPAIQGILRHAADILAKWTDDPSLSGYQTRDPKRVYMMAAAVYAALQQIDLTYINPPASFESEGQRIRLPDQVVESRMGTCLDLAAITAACLEQSGLHSLIIIVKGHAFVGVWLQEECFEVPALEDLLRLRKRVDLNEIVVFDPTCLTNRPLLKFESAVQDAKQHLQDPDSFFCVIDVFRARKGQIRPLPERVERVQPVPAEPETDRNTGFPVAPDLPDLNFTATSRYSLEDEAPGAPETPATRLDRWRRRLLDLTLRNRLLNFRETKKTIPLLCPDLPALEDALAGGAVFQILSRPRDLAEGDPRDPKAHRRRTGEDGLDALLLKELQAKRLYAELGKEELDRRLLDIYRVSRLEMEEGGASALYLAIGFLSWYETPQSSVPRLAPILLLPVELHRRSVREGFTLHLGDDEPRFNVTLLELLKKEHEIQIPGLDPLPEDDSGLDVPKILRIFRKRIRDIERWDILDIARIGIFSFAKFLMWRDLAECSDKLMENRVVDHLVNHPEQQFERDAVFPDADRLDYERSPLQTFCPLPADASQLAAVFAAAEGRSFVLEGPPGTGKSQTITNLIAHCLANGKRVLFVSEKIAALKVVHDRLRKVDLGPYCLELHSNKVSKGEVLAQLGDALSKYEGLPQEEWEREARRLESLRNELNVYVHTLHKRCNNGETVFQAISRLIGLRDVPSVDLHWPSPDTIDVDQLAGLRDLVDRLAVTGAAIDQMSGRAFAAVRCTEWTPAWEKEVRAALDRFSSAVESLDARARETSTRVSLGNDGWSFDELALLDELALILLDSPAPPSAILVQPDWDKMNGQIGNWIDHGRRRDALRSEVMVSFTDKVLSLDIEALQEKLNRSDTSWWPLSWWLRRQVSNALKPAAKNGEIPAKELAAALQRIHLLKDEEHHLASAGDEARALLGHFWKNGEAEWEGIEQVTNWASRFRNLANRAAGSDAEQASEFRENWARVAVENRELLQREGAIGRELLAYRTAYENFYSARQAFGALLEVDNDQAWGLPNGIDALGLSARTFRGWSERVGNLRGWCAWRRGCKEAAQAGLSPLTRAYENGDLTGQDLRRVFERSYLQWWYTAIVSSEPVLAQFFSPEHEKKIEQFRELDDRYTALTRDLIRARLAQGVPNFGGADLPNSEVGILKREIGKRRRQISVRKLFQTIPNLLPMLKPCILMSPISIAQYLDPKHSPFDIVVFDEASQIPVWDAVGAIARGKQAVIVGDPKQLPPTTFFQHAEDEEEDTGEDGIVDDLESILDDCMSARLPWLPLDWHYRSRHESLIAFSNYYYYNNRLLTFPSPMREGVGVSWRHVPGGVYDRGKSATNKAEAEAIVKEVIRRLENPVLKDWSIGIVTFSQAQQTLIENLMEEVRRERSDVDYFFSEEAAEPVFVKNLENVQGDERDVILFSICYGPDSLGRVSMNFGPMNKEGGERRLNVAITRARREVIVFSTLRADQIDLARSRARGVRDLKNFIEYAERGPSAIAEATQYDSAAGFDSPFEKAVYDVLVNKGWEVHRQVGCARYRIDLAVVDPDRPGQYLLGIECDGANYHRAKTARDRDKLREGILRGLGWRLYRIWSTDWWTNFDQEVRKLEAALDNAAKAQPDQMSMPEIPAMPVKSAGRIASQPAVRPSREERSTERPDSRSEASLPVYTPYPVGSALSQPEDLYASSSEERIRNLIAEIVRHEGPVSLRLAVRRLAAHWGLKRTTEKLTKHARGLLSKKLVHLRSSSAGDFLWPVGSDPESYSGFRVPGSNPESCRSAEDLPVEEIANAALFVLKQSISAPEDEVVRETSRLLGFHRTSEAIVKRMKAGIVLLIKRGVVIRDGQVVVLKP